METEKIIEGILAQEEENSKIHIDKVREYLREAILEVRKKWKFKIKMKDRKKRNCYRIILKTNEIDISFVVNKNEFEETEDRLLRYNSQ